MRTQSQLIENYTNIGFCQKSFYTAKAWKKAMQCMKVLIEEGYAEAHDYGRGKGKYRATEKGNEYGFNKLYEIVVKSGKISIEDEKEIA